MNPSTGEIVRRLDTLPGGPRGDYFVTHERRNASEYTFLNGWIGQSIAKYWFESKGYKVETSIPQQRGTENAVSSGDIDIKARKSNRTIYAEVKYWGSGQNKVTLTPSWLVQFMLDRRKLNTLLENHDDASEFLLLYRYPSLGHFNYDKTAKFVNKLRSYYEIPASLLKSLRGKPNTEFVETILRYLIQKSQKRTIEFKVIYYNQIIKELGEQRLKEIKPRLRKELISIFNEIYSKSINELNEQICAPIWGDQ